MRLSALVNPTRHPGPSGALPRLYQMGWRVAVELELSQKGRAEYQRQLKGWAFGLTLPDGEKAAACHWYSDRPAIRRRLAQVVAAKNGSLAHFGKFVR